MVVIIRESIVISIPLDRVWDTVADVDNNPNYWRNLYTVHKVKKDGTVIERDVTVGLRKSSSSQRILLIPKKSVELTMTEGPLKGSRVITLAPMGDNKTKVEISWNLELSSIPIMGKNIMQNNLANDTKEALSKIAEVVE
jgi:uncharacterized membrane protein